MKTSTQSIGNLSIQSGVNVDHPVLKYLQAHGELSKLANQILVCDAATYVSESPTTRTNESLRAGVSVLLLNASEADKKGLVPHIGIGAPGDSTALLITGRPAAHDRLVYELYDLPVHVDNPPNGPEMESSGTFPAGSPEPKDMPTNKPEIKELKGESAPEAYVNQIVEALASPKAADATASDTTAPTQQQWLFNQTLNWGCPQRSTYKGMTPEAQATYLSLTFTFVVYLDQQASGNFQWLYLETLGYQSVGASGMNQNYHDQRGWSNGFVEVVVDAVDGFSINESSPNNVNGETTYTSSVSFNVGVDSSGTGSTGVEVSHSQSETITDWGIKQNDLNNWTFYQNSPWDARNMSNQDGMESYNAGKFYYQVNELPDLSTGVMNFSTMSVWNNQAVSTDTVPVTINLVAEWNFIVLKNEWPAYQDNWYGQYGPYGSSYYPMTFDIDLSLVS